MIENFPACLDVILVSEGGFVDDPQDPGGATNMGITLATLQGWRGAPQTVDDVRDLTEADVSPIYETMYWVPTGCNAWPSGVDLMVFDMAVNQGPPRAVRTLQTAVGVPADGVVGQETKAAVARSNAPALIAHIAVLREQFYKGLPTFPRFGNGWLARVSRTAAAAQQMVSQDAQST